MLKILGRYLWTYSHYVVVGVVVLFGQAMAELNLPSLMGDIVNKGMVAGNTSIIWSSGFKMLGVTFISASCAIASSFFSSRLMMSVGRDIRHDLFGVVENYSLNEYESLGAASLVTRVTNDVVQIQMVVMMGFRFIIFSPIMCVGGLILALGKDTELSYLFVVVIPIITLIIVIVAAKIIPKFTIMQKRIDALNLTMRESLTGIRVIRAFNRQGYEQARFERANRELMDISINVNLTMAMMMPIMMFLMNATTIGIIWFGGVRVAQNSMNIGNMMAFMQYAMQIIMSFLMIAMMFVLVPRAQASAVRVLEALDMKSSINDPDTPIMPSLRGVIEFRDVTFQYAGSESPVLHEVSFKSGPGETTAIIGGTGSGKSTIINLIPRFHDATEGEVLIDGVNVRDMAQAELRSKIGLVPQGAILFSGTISENIRYGKKDATDAEIERAARISQAYDFIVAMPDGFDTMIAQGGTNVSGGQKQRLSIARAVVRNPEIYLFDDSFSALDFKTDAALRKALKGETRQSTVVIVAQRVSSIMDADRIVVLDEGRVVGIGRHNELLNTCEVYYEICSTQLSGEEMRRGGYIDAR